MFHAGSICRRKIDLSRIPVKRLHPSDMGASSFKIGDLAIPQSAPLLRATISTELEPAIVVSGLGLSIDRVEGPYHLVSDLVFAEVQEVGGEAPLLKDSDAPLEPLWGIGVSLRKPQNDGLPVGPRQKCHAA